jgi:flagellar hook-associated protein 1 FlgK
MSGLLGLVNLGARSLNAAQFAQATAGNNAANVATPGYSRRRARITEGPTISTPSAVVGTGVRIVGLSRLRETLLDNQWRLDSNDLQFATAQARILEQVGAIFTPAEDNALINSLNQLFTAFGDVAVRPEDGAARRVLLAQGQSFVDALRLAQSKLLNIEADTVATIRDRMTEANEAAHRLAQLNVNLRANRDDPALRDERDRLIDRLAELIGVRATEQNDGTVQVVVEGTGIQLVDGPRSATIALTGTPTGGSVSIGVDGVALAAAGGEMGGLVAVRNSTTDGLPYALSALDSLASDVITAVNRIHASGSGLSLRQSVTGSVTVSNPGVPLNGAGLVPTPAAGNLTLGVFDSTGAFVSVGTVAVDPATMSLTALAAAIDALPNVDASVTGGRLTIGATSGTNRIVLGPDSSDSLVALGVNGFFTGATAGSIGMSAPLVADPLLIAAAQADLIAGVVSPGDGRNAQALAALGRAAILAGNSQTAAEFLGAVGGVVGTATRSASSRAQTLDVVVRAAENQRLSIAGVNLDEELADMVRFQHAYEASARFIKTIDEMIVTLLEVV